MANRDEQIISLLQRLVEQGATQAKALEGIQTNGIKGQQKAEAEASRAFSVGKGLGQAAGGGIMGAANAFGVGGLAGGLMSANPAGIAASATQSLIDNTIGQLFETQAEQNKILKQGIENADPFEYEGLTDARIRQKQIEARRVSEAKRRFRLRDWKSGFFNYDMNMDEEIARFQNMTNRRMLAPKLRSADTAAQMTRNQLGGFSYFGNIDQEDVNRVYKLNLPYATNNTEFERKLRQAQGIDKTAAIEQIYR